MTTRSIEIVPDPSLMEDIAASSLTLADAIVELIANSIDAKIDGEELEIDVFVSDDEVRVVDNGSGMTADVLAQAVRLGVKMDAVTGNTGKRKGMYGLGLKTAAGSVGRVWSVVTRPVEEEIELSVTFDLTKWKKAAGRSDFDWKIDLTESVPDTTGPLGERSHGTAIVMTQPRSGNPMAGPVLDKIGHAYRPHLEAGHVIRVNGEPTPQRQYEYFEESCHEFTTDLGDGKVISGWFAVDKKTHNDGLYGMNLYREGQLIEAWNKDWFRAHLMTSRVIGEVHADFLPVNFNKQGVEQNTDEWKQVSAAMRETLKPVVRASQEMARNKSDQTRFTRAIDGIKNAMGKGDQLGDIGESDNVDGENPIPQTAPRDDVDVEAEHLTVDGERIALSFVIAEFQSETTPWSYIYEDETLELQAVVNSNSKLFEMVKRDQGVIGALALADSVREFLMSEKAMSPERSLDIRNRWLYLSAGGE